MKFNKWVDQESGRLTKLSKHFGITLSAVSQWRKQGVPVKHMKAVRDLTDGSVTLDEMVPSSARKSAGKARAA